MAQSFLGLDKRRRCSGRPRAPVDFLPQRIVADTRPGAPGWGYDGIDAAGRFATLPLSDLAGRHAATIWLRVDVLRANNGIPPPAAPKETVLLLSNDFSQREHRWDSVPSLPREAVFRYCNDLSQCERSFACDLARAVFRLAQDAVFRLSNDSSQCEHKPACDPAGTSFIFRLCPRRRVSG